MSVSLDLHARVSSKLPDHQCQSTEQQHHEPAASDTLRQITVTNYGWFHPDPQIGINVPRCLAMKDFTEAVVAHDRFNASAWHNLEQQPDPKCPIIAFLDIDTCRLRHWPNFHGHFALSSDREGGRQPMTAWNLGSIVSKGLYHNQARRLGRPLFRRQIRALSC